MNFHTRVQFNKLNNMRKSDINEEGIQPLKSEINEEGI